MVVADQGNWLADVVFVVEGTANLSPYVESLKANYIIPTLEYFSGSPPDERDCGCDYNSTMYALVVFMAADCAPEPAATCYLPTTSTHKLLSSFERISFIGGSGEAYSHITEGLSTALQVFDDFQSLREQGVVAQKYCILVCNSPPYPLPALENPAHSGLMAEQLTSIMAERQVNFSILSPRKIPTLFKLYEKAGGDLQHALKKNYAKDRRHLVLLKGFQLQERPMSPLENKVSVCSPPSTSQKRPLTSSPPNPRESSTFKQPTAQSTSGTSLTTAQSQSQQGSQGPLSTAQAAVSYGQTSLSAQQSQRPTSSHLSSLNQPNPPNITITNKTSQAQQLPGQHTESIRPGHSPLPVSGPRMSWTQPAAPSPPSTPSTTSVLASQLSMAPSNVSIRHPTPSLQQQPVTLSSLVPQSQAILNTSQPGVMAQAPGGLRPGVSAMPLRTTTTTQGPVTTIAGVNGSGALAVQLAQLPSFAQQQTMSIASTLPSQGIPITIQSKMVNVTSVNQLVTSQVPIMATAPSTSLPPHASQVSTSSIALAGQNPPSQLSGAISTSAVKERRSVWQGILEYQEKPPIGGAPNNPATRVTHSLPCTFSSAVINGEPEVTADKWPNRLSMQLLPRQLVMAANISSILKTASRHVILHFSQESEGLQKLSKIMGAGWLGCIQFPPGSIDIRIMMVLFVPEKKLFMGFIANDQETFYNAIRQMCENHRKQQQAKQQKLISGNTLSTSGGMVLPSSTSSQGIMLTQPNAGNLGASGSQLGPRGTLGGPGQPVGQSSQQPQPQPPPPPPPPPQAQAQTSSLVHTTLGQQNLTPQQASRLSQLEAERQQNLLKIQQLQQTLEAAQQKELQYKAAQEQQQQQQQQQQVYLERQNIVRQIQQQQQRLQQLQQITQSGPNPQLRHLLQQVPQQIRQHPHQQLMLQQQHPGIRTQMSTPQGSVSQQQASQQQQQNQAWDDQALLNLI